MGKSRMRQVRGAVLKVQGLVVMLMVRMCGGRG
jgi:hypothetical protein